MSEPTPSATPADAPKRRRASDQARRPLRALTRLMNFYPPFRGAGIRVRKRDFAAGVFEVEMKLHWWNKNAVGTHFGGSLYMMCDPFYLLILLDRLGPGYVCWDKAATIRFRRPGRGLVTARFEIPPERVAEIRQEVEQKGKTEPVFTAQVLDESGEVVAEIEKVLYVRRG